MDTETLLIIIAVAAVVAVPSIITWRNSRHRKRVMDRLTGYIDNGFGSIWSAYCPSCGRRTMEIVRPGKARCSRCGYRGEET